MKKILILVAILISGVISASAQQKSQSPLEPGDYSWMSQIRGEHPRMFITKDDIPYMRKAAETFEKETFLKSKKRADALLDKEIVFENPLAKTGESNGNRFYGYYACDAALMWLLTEDQKYLELTKNILSKLIPYYQQRVDNDLNIEWYAMTQVCAMCAYDWIYNDLTPGERETFGRPLYNVMYDIAWHGPGIRKSRARENVSDYRSGCYGVAVLPWFIGLTFWNEGYDDRYCEDMLRRGYDYLQKMVDFRAQMLGTKGGGASGVPWYCLAYYPYSEYNLIYTFRSAMGIDISEKMDYMIGYLNYTDWIRLPGNQEYGFGDSSHYKCNLPVAYLNAHVNELANIFGERHPEILPVAARLAVTYNQRRDWDPIPFMRLMHRIDPLSGVDASSSQTQTEPNMPKSMYFDTMGQLYMRSGVGDDDTYAMFVIGGIPEQHKHYDNNHFTIFKKGYRALDSGTRPEPGLHLPYYYCRTVAHNCVTVYMPGETFKKYWGSPASCEDPTLGQPNDGGQCSILGSVLLAHEETDDYVYIASDAENCYHKDKVDGMVREVVWCPPDVFVIFDRVVTDKPEYQKAWLYHTAAEPMMNGKLEFSEVSQGGKSICRTLFPKNAKVEKIGGPGKQFWCDGRNWPLPVLTPDDYGYASRGNVPPNDWPLVGQWRVEVKPGKASRYDYFMHMIQVGDESLETLPKTRTFDDKTSVGVKFDYNGKHYRIAFIKDAENGCEIKVTQK